MAHTWFIEFIRNDNIHKDLQIVKIADLIRTLSRNFHNSLLNSTGSLHYNLHIHPPLQRRLKCGRPHDLISTQPPVSICIHLCFV